MGFEIPVDVDYFAHPKTLKLIAVLDRTEADVYPLRLWRWASSYARDGRLPGDVRQIEVAVGWRGRSGRLHSALVEAGFIEKDGFTLHSWGDHIGRSIRIYEQKKRKQREKYDREKGILPEESRQYSPNPGGEGKLRRGQEAEPAVPAPSAAILTPSPTEQFLAKTWNDGPGISITGTKAAEQIQAAIDVGVSAGAIEAAFMDHEKIKGLKIWEVLDPMRPSRKDKIVSERRDSHGPKKI